mmetsp:Transcript_27106/g.88926  ORF Transcript_27106/g.88926 Transcript_27106/m.88926 type:complete len:225 (+) Transcript_27106:764-1438(+)
MMDCPIMAHPPMPAKKPVTMLASPCASTSTCVSVRRDVMSSTRDCVRSVSMMPTAATLAANGETMESVSRLSGTCGRWNAGRDPAIEARSPTVRVLNPSTCVNPVTVRMAARGAGTACVSFGSALMMATVNAVRPHMIISGSPDNPANCSNCARPMTSARPLTNPSIAGCGTSLINFPSLHTPATICNTPASTTPANKYSIPCFATSGAKTTAVAPAAPEMTPG